MVRIILTKQKYTRGVTSQSKLENQLLAQHLYTLSEQMERLIQTNRSSGKNGRGTIDKIQRHKNQSMNRL